MYIFSGHSIFIVFGNLPPCKADEILRLSHVTEKLDNEILHRHENIDINGDDNDHENVNINNDDDEDEKNLKLALQMSLRESSSFSAPSIFNGEGKIIFKSE